MKYRGVTINIDKEEIPGSSLKELKSGEMKEVKPKFMKFYRFADSYNYGSAKECKEAIDRIISELGEDYNKEVFTKVMNSD